MSGHLARRLRRRESERGTPKCPPTVPELYPTLKRASQVPRELVPKSHRSGSNRRPLLLRSGSASGFSRNTNNLAAPPAFSATAENAESDPRTVREVSGRFPVIADSTVPTGVVYGLVDPREIDRVRYVGYTRQHPEMRLRGHLGESPLVHRSSRKVAWIAALAEIGVSPVMVLLERTADYGILPRREAHWYAELRAAGQADLNRTPPSGVAPRRTYLLALADVLRDTAPVRP